LQNARQFYQICQPSEFETNFYLSSSKKKIDDYNNACGTNIGFDLTYESISSTPTPYPALDCPDPCDECTGKCEITPKMDSNSCPLCPSAICTRVQLFIARILV
jgi:hypothetical protein